MTGEAILCKLKEYYNVGGLCKTFPEELSCSKGEETDRICKMILADIPETVDITRKQTAIIVHEFIKKVLGEPDETDTSGASVLKDLYDCRICVKHIEQVYVKGIMEPVIGENDSGRTGLPLLFGCNDILTETEADEIVERVYKRERRL